MRLPSSIVSHKGVRSVMLSQERYKEDRKERYRSYFDDKGFSDKYSEVLARFVAASAEPNKHQLRRNLCRFAARKGIPLDLEDIRDLP